MIFPYLLFYFLCIGTTYSPNIRSAAICGLCPLPSGHLPLVPHDFRLDAPVCLVLVCGCPTLCRQGKTECSHFSGRSLSHCPLALPQVVTTVETQMSRCCVQPWSPLSLLLPWESSDFLGNCDRVGLL